MTENISLALAKIRERAKNGRVGSMTARRSGKALVKRILSQIDRLEISPGVITYVVELREEDLELLRLLGRWLEERT